MPASTAHRSDSPSADFDTLATEFLSRPGIESGRMFGSSGLKAGGKVFGMLVKGRLVVKLPAARVNALIGAGTGSLFDPGHGRPMREWISVAAGGARLWRALMDESLAYVVTLDGR